jgi:hypothetical protein
MEVKETVVSPCSHEANVKAYYGRTGAVSEALRPRLVGHTAMLTLGA